MNEVEFRAKIVMALRALAKGNVDDAQDCIDDLEEFVIQEIMDEPELGFLIKEMER